MRFVATSLLLAAFVTAGCGDPGDASEGETFELAQVEGLDGPADYAGGNYVKVKGALTVGRSKIGTLTGRDVYHGYALTAKRGDVIRLRGLSGVHARGLTALYGPKAANGSWGSQIIKRWSFRAVERSVPIAEHEVTRAGTYLAVYGQPGRTDDGVDTPYSLTACKGECKAGGCADGAGFLSNGYRVINMVSRAEAEVLAGPNARTGSCGSQPTSCPRTRAPVCGEMWRRGRSNPETYSNICLAKVALREAAGTDLGPLQMVWSQGVCPN